MGVIAKQFQQRWKYHNFEDDPQLLLYYIVCCDSERLIHYYLILLKCFYTHLETSSFVFHFLETNRITLSYDLKLYPGIILLKCKRRFLGIIRCWLFNGAPHAGGAVCVALLLLPIPLSCKLKWAVSIDRKRKKVHHQRAVGTEHLRGSKDNSALFF